MVGENGGILSYELLKSLERVSGLSNNPYTLDWPSLSDDNYLIHELLN